MKFSLEIPVPNLVKLPNNVHAQERIEASDYKMNIRKEK